MVKKKQVFNASQPSKTIMGQNADAKMSTPKTESEKCSPKPQTIKSVSVVSVIGVLSVAFRLEVDTIQNKISVRMKKLMNLYYLI